MQRVQLPLLIFLELLTLALLAVAAARPMIRTESLGRPTVVILDASYSMTAGTGNDTAQQRALDDLNNMLAGPLGTQPIGFPVQLITAGTKPQILPGRAKNAAEAQNILKAWHCEAPSADLDAAVALASNISTPGTKILVVTDHAPQSELTEGRVLWKSYGKKLANVAIIHVSRVYHEDASANAKDRLLLELANLSDTPQTLRMSMVDPRRQRVLFQEERVLEAGQTHLMRTGIPTGVETLEIRLDNDALALDNQLTVLPPSRRPVRVQLADLPSELAPKIRKAVEAAGIASIVEDRPDIIFGDGVSETQEGQAAPWQVRFVTETNSEHVQSLIGPFIVDHSSPLATGLSLDGVVWSAGEDRNENAIGVPIISAGAVPLLLERRERGGARQSGSRQLIFRYNDKLSTLTGGPAWPILVWNILKYRAGQTVGFTANNVKLGTEAEFVPAAGDTQLTITPPEKQGMKQHRIALTGSSVRVPAEADGIYRAKTASGEYAFAVGTLSVTESNLQQAETTTLGNWFDEETLRSDFRPVAWALLLGSLLVLTAHLWFVSTEKN